MGVPRDRNQETKRIKSVLGAEEVPLIIVLGLLITILSGDYLGPFQVPSSPTRRAAAGRDGFLSVEATTKLRESFSGRSRQNPRRRLKKRCASGIQRWRGPRQVSM